MRFSTPSITVAIVALFSLTVEATPVNTLGRRGDQFVTGPCTQDSDCQQGCCALTTGTCADPSIAQCGFSITKPNCNVAAALNLNACAPGATSSDPTSPAVNFAAKYVLKP
ncbi:hypothetical protein BD410DRAFT_838940 [Rickenella mellea]|uniref:Hydrophobin n=1 Tax=Rickenella mellea TaxID=50990 RepID=A0A4Y7Q7Q3_9AGAM|nr:hypothetical protein BD410DRAFT_838940 [Rickenella mellea]